MILLFLGLGGLVPVAARPPGRVPLLGLGSDAQPVVGRSAVFDRMGTTPGRQRRMSADTELDGIIDAEESGDCF